MAVLLPSRTPSAFADLAFFGALAPFLTELVFLLDRSLDGATRGFRARPLAFVVAFGYWAVAVAAAWAVSWASVVDVVMFVSPLQ